MVISEQQKTFLAIAGVILTISSILTWQIIHSSKTSKSTQELFVSNSDLPPLKMTGGDPYIRALMRTISYSESNSPKPYHIIYGGQYVEQLDRHPDQCITIKAGPNKGNCSTAAGRYQMINKTWDLQAKKYHPNPDRRMFFWITGYSFAPEYQDKVVHQWLQDRSAWNYDIPQLLRENKFTQVQKILSPTWTSFGYGIENNPNTAKLPIIYQRALKEELSRK